MTFIFCLQQQSGYITPMSYSIIQCVHNCRIEKVYQRFHKCLQRIRNISPQNRNTSPFSDHSPSELTILQGSKGKTYRFLRNHPTGIEKYSKKYFSSTNLDDRKRVERLGKREIRGDLILKENHPGVGVLHSTPSGQRQALGPQERRGDQS